MKRSRHLIINRVIRCCIIIFSILLLVYFCIILFESRSNLPIVSSVISLRDGSTNRSSEKRKKIVFWTKLFGEPVRTDVFDECGTELNNKCIFTLDRNQIDEAAAVLFHVNDFSLTDLPKNRSKEQRYVFLTMEVAENNIAGILDVMPEGFFNWSMTYRRDSDVPMPYGGWWVDPEKTKALGYETEQFSVDPATVMKEKTKSIFWLVSNCNTNSKRELAVKRLSQYINVNIIGNCSERNGSRNICRHGSSKCEEKLANEHFFFLALENTVCEDYITEKYWNRYSLPCVPIFMKHYVYENLLPPKSYIAMDDFKSPREMAEYLQMLMKNQSAYLSYFSWRNDGWSHPWQTPGYRLGYCKLCEELLEQRPPKVIKNVKNLLFETGKCERDEFAQSWV